MSDKIILPSKQDLITHNRDFLQDWGNRITANNFRALLLISMNETGKIMITAVETIPPAELVSVLQTMAQEIKKTLPNG
jgi:hypothetical protein